MTARVLTFTPAAKDCVVCGEPRAAHKASGCPKRLPAAEIRARLRKTLARCLGATAHPFAVDVEEGTAR